MASPAASPQLPQAAGPVGTAGKPLEPGQGALPAALEAYSQKDTSKGKARLPRVDFILAISLACAAEFFPGRLSALLSAVPTLSTVVIRFQPSPNAPVLKQKFYKITASNKFQAVIAFLRKELGWKPSDSLVRTPSAAGPPGSSGPTPLPACNFI